MRSRIVYPLLALVIFISSAQAQIGDWQNVEDIRSGLTIFVQGDRHFARCTFEHATDSALFCEQASRSPFFEPREIRFERTEIRRVSIEYFRDGNAAKGALVGMGVGATLGAVSGDQADGRSRLGGAIIVGTIGAVFGSMFARSFRTVHSQVIYQQ